MDSFSIQAKSLRDADIKSKLKGGIKKWKKMRVFPVHSSSQGRERNKQLYFVFSPCPNVRMLRKWNLMMAVLDQQKTSGGFNICGWYDKRVWDSLIYSPQKGKWEMLSLFFCLFLWNISYIFKRLQNELMEVLEWTVNYRRIIYFIY